MAFRFGRAYVEYLHDEVVAYSVGLGEEPVSPEEYRDHNLIESACARPFQSAFGEEAHPGVYRKAAVFFHSLVCNHCFSNGNKRTALVALDHFLAANDYCFTLDNDDAYKLARDTASHNADHRHVNDVINDLSRVVEENCFPIDYMAEIHDEENQYVFMELYNAYFALRQEVQSHELNVVANLEEQ